MLLETIVRILEERQESAAREVLNGMEQQAYWSKVGEYKAYTKMLDDIHELASKLRKGEKI